MDTLPSVLLALILGAIIIYNVYGSYFRKKPKDDTEQSHQQILSQQIDKFIEKDRQKDIIHQTSVNKLAQEITSLKEKQSELVLTNKNWEKSYNQLNAEQLLKIGSLEKQILDQYNFKVKFDGDYYNNIYNYLGNAQEMYWNFKSIIDN